MRLLLSVLAISCVSAAAFASDGIPARDRLSGLDGVKFGMDFAAVKLELGAGARVDVDPSDPAVRVLLASRTLFGEKFSFNEKLHAYADFVPDLQPADVPSHTRALADVCLALLNSNEFAYVY